MNINITLIGQAITFAIFIWFTMKFVWPLIMSAMDEREKKIADGLAAGERGHYELERSKKQAAEEIEMARGKAMQIIEQANQQANKIIEQGKISATQAADKIVSNAYQQVELYKAAASQQLSTEIVSLAITGAERILRKELAADQLQVNLLSDLVTKFNAGKEHA